MKGKSDIKKVYAFYFTAVGDFVGAANDECFFTSRVAFANEILVEDGPVEEEKENYSELLLKAGNSGDPIRDELIPPWG